ncbi:hypothetical protein [Rhizobium leguminosarum]|uniref:hypothetical protein n=1 Tax=Rhizobium leguminosarum TaxID=384 RepID=UPI001C96DD0B|nr:hypothetical protein [Rhizobium leguminosarum]MBY5581873.1 hypothetical protein [Rhizobium leguminosarum]
MSTYVIAKVAPSKWEITHSQPGWIGTHIGFYSKRKAAETTARVLAGRMGKVVIK